MVGKKLLWCRFLQFILLLAFMSPSICLAAETPLGLIVRESGISLYSRQELDSDKIATLQKGAVLTPLAEAIGQQTWYMVKTQDGLFGWVRATDVSGTDELRASFNEQIKEQRHSTWSARTAAGRVFEGGWSVDPSSSPDKASGTWTLEASGDKTRLRGTWSAHKFSTGWSGTWRAAAEGQRREFTGSWTADFPQARDTDMAELFLTAARDAIRGIWSANGDSGSWVIQAAE
ncbi:MAG TPA: SH3 domain-containing protein [Candidatus Binatia bacterium]|nr:SH3 domain-containing protein [Candidatus Binatia bacterium]